MSTTIKITIIAAAALLFQSCSMAKHYGNMRIGHSKEESTEQAIENKPVTEALQTPQTNKPASVIDETPATEVELIKTDSLSKTIFLESVVQKDTKPMNTTVKPERTVLKTINLPAGKVGKITRKIKSVIKPKLKLTKPGASNKEMTIDDWGYIAIGLAVAAFIVLIIITGSFLGALILAVQFFLILISLVAIGIILYGFWAILNFLGGGYA